MSNTAAAETRTKFDRGAFVRQYAIVGILVLFVLGLSLATGGKFLQATLDEVEPMSSPYFSMIVIPGEKWRG